MVNFTLESTSYLPGIYEQVSLSIIEKAVGKTTTVAHGDAVALWEPGSYQSIPETSKRVQATCRSSWALARGCLVC